MSSRSAGPSEANGSSSSSTGRSRTSARASATRWRSPPDSSRGRRFSLPASPVRLERRRRSPSRSAAVSRSAGEMPSPTLAADVEMRKQIVLLEDHRHRPCAGGSAVTSAPPISTRPACGVSKPAIRLSSVDLPEPLGPMIAVIAAGLKCDVETHRHLAIAEATRRRGGPPTPAVVAARSSPAPCRTGRRPPSSPGRAAPSEKRQPGRVGGAVAAHAAPAAEGQRLHGIAAEQRDHAEIAERQRHGEGEAGERAAGGSTASRSGGSGSSRRCRAMRQRRSWRSAAASWAGRMARMHERHRHDRIDRDDHERRQQRRRRRHGGAARTSRRR